MMIMTTTISICITILVQRNLVDKLFIIFCYLRTLMMMMMEATTEKKADNLSATKSMLVFLCRSIYWKTCFGLFFFLRTNQQERFLVILRLCNLATLTIVIMIKVIWSDPAHRLTGALLVLVDMSATFLVNTC